MIHTGVLATRIPTTIPGAMDAFIPVHFMIHGIPTTTRIITIIRIIRDITITMVMHTIPRQIRDVCVTMDRQEMFLPTEEE